MLKKSQSKKKATNTTEKSKKRQENNLIPVSILCGYTFLTYPVLRLLAPYKKIPIEIS